MAKKVDTGKGGKGDSGKGDSGKDKVNYTKWKGMGYLEGIDETTGEAIAEYLEAAQTNFNLQIDIDLGVATTGQGTVAYDKQDILYETIVALYQKKNDPKLVIDYDDIYTEVKSALNSRFIKMFDSDQKSTDKQPYFDSTNHYAFRDWFLNAYIQKLSGKGKGK